MDCCASGQGANEDVHAPAFLVLRRPCAGAGSAALLCIYVQATMAHEMMDCEDGRAVPVCTCLWTVKLTFHQHV